MDADQTDTALFEGLKALSESAFPKSCSCCGRRFETAEEFLKETRNLPRGSGLKKSVDDDDTPMVELYRNCVCGSTLMDLFSDRRDTSSRGLERRRRFDKILGLLESRGMASNQARRELLALMGTGRSEALEALGFKFQGRPTGGGADS